MNKYLYFAYGMNTNVQGMADRCPMAVSLGPAKLLGHSFRFAGPADVVKRPNKTVEGVLWLITDTCLGSLDVLEGYPYFYDRKYCHVLFNDETVQAITYFMQPGNLTSPPSQGYFDIVKEGYDAHGIPTDQLYNALSAPLSMLTN